MQSRHVPKKPQQLGFGNFSTSNLKFHEVYKTQTLHSCILLLFIHPYVASESEPVMSSSVIVTSSSTIVMYSSTTGISTSMLSTQSMATQTVGKIT